MKETVWTSTVKRLVSPRRSGRNRSRTNDWSLARYLLLTERQMQASLSSSEQGLSASKRSVVIGTH
jgi:hypothetical protein